MAKVNTVNVVEYVDGMIYAVHAFTDDKEGNKQAEAHFTKIAKRLEFGMKDIEIGLEEGCLQNEEIELYLVHAA